MASISAEASATILSQQGEIEQIASAINEMNTTTHSVASNAGRAAESAQTITSSVSRINEMNMEIASASEEQSAVAEEI